MKKNMQFSELCGAPLLRLRWLFPRSQAWVCLLVSYLYRALAKSRFPQRLTMAAIPTREGRERVERLTEAEATAFINNDKETIKTELNRSKATTCQGVVAMAV